MMKFKAVAHPAPYAGQVKFDKDQTVPNDAMSLKEILARFVRGEKVAVGRDGSYDEGEEDLEKLRDMDPVDRDEAIAKMKATQKRYTAQEKARVKKLEDEERAKIAAKLAAEKKAEGPPNPIG